MKLYKYILAAVVLVNTAACTNNFLDYEPEDAMPTEDVFKEYETAEAALLGTYDNLSSYAFDGLYVPIMGDLMGDDLMVDSDENWGWFVEAYQVDVLPTYQWNYTPWVQGYKVIYDANNVVTYANRIEDATTEEINGLIAEAKTLRAYSYLKLAQMFCEGYTTNPQGKGLILYTKPASVSEEYLGRSTIQETYDRIITDLKDAEEIFEADSLSTSFYAGRFTLTSVRGLLARTYLNMGEWENARDYAVLAYNDSNVELGDYSVLLNGFYTPDEETMFYIDYTQDDNNVYLTIPSFYYPVYGYSSMRATDDFVDLFASSDYRSYLFLDQSEETEEDQIIDADDIMILKFIHNSTIGNASLIKMRVAEMYLIAAECEAELGNDSEAAEALQNVQSRALPGTPLTSAKGQDLIDEILVERRKELFGEGFRWNDIKRRNLGITRTSNHWVNLDIQPGSSEYYRLVFPIPQDEMDANSTLTSEDQNTGY